MPDHPSWPAELVEKGTAALNELLSSSGDWSDATPAMVEAVLSALSGDLVPREEHEAEVEKLSAHIDRLCDRTFALVEKASAEDGSDLPPARVLLAQADALAEALEDCIGNLDAGMSDSNRIARAARSALASYRKTASGETETRIAALGASGETA